jgi:hypothetical protein
MTTSSELNADYRKERMEMLAEAAAVCRPRLFAIHGLYNNADHGDILGWGMEFPDGEGAIFTDPMDRAVHQSDTAERVLRVMSIVGDVRLTWLDDE